MNNIAINSDGAIVKIILGVSAIVCAETKIVANPVIIMIGEAISLTNRDSKWLYNFVNR